MQNIHQKTLAAAASGALVLTANKRLFRYLRELFDEWMLERGKQVWSTPLIFSYEGWLSKCLDDLGESWRLLNQYQEKYLWGQQIESASRGTSLELLQISKTAEKAVHAHHLLNEYGLDLRHQALTEDQRMFVLWQDHYRSLCEKNSWIDLSDLPQRICKALKEKLIGLPQRLLLVGFDQLTPGLKLLRETATELGSLCEVDMPTAVDSDVKLYKARDKQHEIESIARWTRHLLEQGATSIGIVVPDLQQQRRQIERIIRDQVDPQAAPLLSDEETAFSLSLGTPLAEQGVIHAALAFLHVGPVVSGDQFSFLLRTPYLGGYGKEADARALFDQKIRSYKQQTFKLSMLINQVRKTSGLSLFSSSLEQMQQLYGLKNHATPGYWAEQFANFLKAIDWPGDRTTTSREYQSVKAWREKVLETLAMLDLQSTPIARHHALTLVRQLSKDIEFQPEAPTGAVQVVGLLESSGLAFQHLWVMGLSATLMPARPQPNPFIPYAVQEKYSMPHATAERELQFAEQVIARLKSSSTDIVFSYPSRDGDSELRPSPLIQDCSQSGEPRFSELNDLLNQVNMRSVELETVKDVYGPEVKEAQSAGGTSLLKDQAHCPFRAFVHHRLHCRAFEQPVPGISALARGDLVHLALEKIWQSLQTQTHLMALNEKQLGDLIHSQVRAATDDYFKARSAPGERMLTLEVERVENLIHDWLVNVECQRDGFAILETEQQHLVQIGPLQIKLKIDRIDQLANGYRIVIDYKTGTDLHAEDFLTVPLIEPQLPMYAVSHPGRETDGIVFAQIRKGSCHFLGLVRDKGMLARVKDLSGFAQAADMGISDWSELLIFWRHQLDQLAEDFANGKAAVQPFDREKSCRYCDLTGICRIQEISPGGADDE